MSTIFLNTFMVFVLGAATPSATQLSSPAVARVRADADTTVGHLFEEILRLSDGQEFILELRREGPPLVLAGSTGHTVAA